MTQHDINVRQINAAPVGSDDYQPWLYVVEQDGKTLGRFQVEEYESAEAAKAAALTLAQELEANPWVSPFWKHRGILLADYGTAQKLASLCLNLWNGNDYKVDLGSLLAGSDAKHRAIAFELMESYAKLGENDEDFMALCDEIRAMRG